MPARPASNCSVCSFERGYTWTATRCHTHNRFSQSAKLFVTVASGEGEREKKEKKNAWRHSIYLNSNTFLLTPFHKYHVYLHIKQTPVKKKSAEWLPITAFHHDFFLLLFFTAIYILVRLRHIYSSSPMPVNAIETAYPSRLPRTQ